LMAGRRLQQSQSISRLTSPHDSIPSCYRRTRHTKFQHNARRHLLLALLSVGVFLIFSLVERVLQGAADTVPAASAALTAIAAIFGAAFLTWRGVVAHWQARAAQSQTQIARDVHYTAIFGKAVEQLGATREMVRTVDQETVRSTEPNLEVRLGAIYALERVARDSERDHWPIMEVLCAYIRNPQNCGVPSVFDKALGSDAEAKWHDEMPALRVDAQAALSVIARRSQSQVEFESKNSLVLDLSGANLQRARLDGGNLSNAQFGEASFDRAFLSGVNFEGADFNHCSLHEVTFRNGRLRSANFNEAFSKFVRFEHSDLRCAWLGNAELEYSRFSECDLTCASFEWSTLSNVTFENSNLSGASFCMPKLKSIEFGEGCVFQSALFIRTDFSQTSGISQSAINETIGDASVILPAQLVRPDNWFPEELGVIESSRLYDENIERFGLRK
jgi:uncharacterized protein YjbI with pentapeptide repeats